MIINLVFLQSAALSSFKILSWSLKVDSSPCGFLQLAYSLGLMFVDKDRLHYKSCTRCMKCQTGAPKIDPSISKRAFELNDRRYFILNENETILKVRVCCLRRFAGRSLVILRAPPNAMQFKARRWIPHTHTHALLQISLRPSMKIVSPSKRARR